MFVCRGKCPKKNQTKLLGSASTEEEIKKNVEKAFRIAKKKTFGVTFVCPIDEPIFCASRAAVKVMYLWLYLLDFFN